MKDIEKLLEEYQREVLEPGHERGLFTVEDVYSIREIAGPDSVKNVITALRLGYMVGYRKGGKDNEKF